MAGPNLLIDGEKMLRDPLAPVRLQGYVRFKTPDRPSKDVGPFQWSYSWDSSVTKTPTDKLKC